MEPIKLGDKVKPNDEARRRSLFPQHPDRVGTVVGGTSECSRCFMINWDGTKGAQSVNKNFVEKTH